MSITDKIKRLEEALRSEKDPDIIKASKAIIQGMAYFHLGVNNRLAQKRFDDHCGDCEHNVSDPVNSMRVEDDKIKALSGRMCDHCGGCVLSYKIRQNVKKCEYWNE